MNRQSEMARGFTLIELMIVVVVMTILMVIAVPSYMQYIQRANRANAKAALLRDAQWMERVATAQGGYPTQLAVGLDQVDGGRYTVALQAGATTTAFTLVATRVPGQGNANDPCGDFTLTQAGVRGVINNVLSVAGCWNN